MTTKKIPIKVGVYARVSTDRQELENQLIQLRKYCKEQEWEIYWEYCDVQTGKSTSRPAFNQLFMDSHKRLFQTVLFWDLSRFSRSGMAYTMQKLKELENLGIAWHSYTQPFFSTMGQFREIVIAIMSELAKIEREFISERTKAGLKRAKIQGKTLGRPKESKDKSQRFRKWKKKPVWED